MAWDATTGALTWADRPPICAPPTCGRQPRLPDRTAPAGRGLVRTLGARLAGAAFLIDYGFPGARVLPPAAPHGHGDVPPRPPQADADPLVEVGQKTSPPTSTSLGWPWPRRMRAGGAGLHQPSAFSSSTVACPRLWRRPTCPRVAARLLAEHEMGELFKVIGDARAVLGYDGFAHGDRTHRLCIFGTG